MRITVSGLAKFYRFFLIALPLVFVPLEIEWFETPKQYFVTLTALITLPYILKYRSEIQDILESKVTLLLFSLFLTLTLSSIFNGFFLYSLIGSPFRKDGLISIWSIFILFLGFSLLYRYKYENLVIESIKASALMVSILGIIQFLLGYATIWNGDYFFDGRITSTLGQPNFLSSFLLTTLPFFLKKEKVNILGLGIIFLCLFLTFSRLNILLLLTVFLISILTTKNKKIKVIGGIISISLVIGIVIFFTTVSTDELYSKLQQNPKLYQLQRNLFFISRQHLLGEKRFAIYASGINTVLERPILGYGRAMIEPALRDNIRKYPVLENLVIDSSHNLFIDTAIEGGVLALVLLGALLSLTLFILSNTDQRHYKYAFLLLITSSQFFITSISVFVYLVMLISKTTNQN